MHWRLGPCHEVIWNNQWQSPMNQWRLLLKSVKCTSLRMSGLFLVANAVKNQWLGLWWVMFNRKLECISECLKELSVCDYAPHNINCWVQCLMWSLSMHANMIESGKENCICKRELNVHDGKYGQSLVSFMVWDKLMLGMYYESGL